MVSPLYPPGFISWLITVIVIAIIWEAIWKGIAMWKSARNNQLAWYICILIFNTVGILPIIYLAFFQNKQEASQPAKKARRKR